MTLEYREDATGRAEPVATACPYCGVAIVEAAGELRQLCRTCRKDLWGVSS